MIQFTDMLGTQFHGSTDGFCVIPYSIIETYSLPHRGAQSLSCWWNDGGWKDEVMLKPALGVPGHVGEKYCALCGNGKTELSWVSPGPSKSEGR